MIMKDRGHHTEAGVVVDGFTEVTVMVIRDGIKEEIIQIIMSMMVDVRITETIIDLTIM